MKDTRKPMGSQEIKKSHATTIAIACNSMAKDILENNQLPSMINIQTKRTITQEKHLNLGYVSYQM